MANENDQIIEDEEVVEDQSQDDAHEETQEEIQDDEVQEQEEEQLDDEQEQSDASGETQQHHDEQPSRRETLRIQSLLKKYPSLNDRVAPQQDGIDYKSMIDADETVYNQLSEASQRYGNQQYQQGLKQANAITFSTRLEVDAPKIASKYPQLDKDSDNFNPAVASSFNEMYLSAVGYNAADGSVTNPNLRYADYVEAMFELVDEAANRKVETSTRNITRRASRTGLRPDGSSAERLDLGKAPQAMSDKELDAFIARSGLAPKKR